MLTPDVNPVSDPGGPQLPVAPAQQDGDLGGTGAMRLQEQLEAAILRPVQVVVEGERAVVGARGLELRAGEDGWGTGLSHRDQEGAPCTVPAVITPWPGGAPRASGTAVPGPAL